MQTFLQILPIALALAFSTVPILAALLLLLSPNRSRSAVPFLIGWVGGMFLLALGATYAAQFIPVSRLPRRPDEAVGQLQIIVGAALIVVGIFSFWRGRRREQRSIPQWLRSVETLGPVASFGLAVALNLRPKSLLLAIAVGLILRADVSDPAAALIALIVYTAIGASTVAVPIVAALAAPERTEPRLVSSREWLVRNGDAITSIIVILVGALIIGFGAVLL